MSVGIITSKPASVPRARPCDLKLARELLVIYFLTTTTESHESHPRISYAIIENPYENE